MYFFLGKHPQKKLLMEKTSQAQPLGISWPPHSSTQLQGKGAPLFSSFFSSFLPETGQVGRQGPETHPCWVTPG